MVGLYQALLLLSLQHTDGELMTSSSIQTLLLSNLTWPLTPGDQNSSPNVKSIETTLGLKTLFSGLQLQQWAFFIWWYTSLPAKCAELCLQHGNIGSNIQGNHESCCTVFHHKNVRCTSQCHILHFPMAKLDHCLYSESNYLCDKLGSNLWVSHCCDEIHSYSFAW